MSASEDHSIPVPAFPTPPGPSRRRAVRVWSRVIHAEPAVGVSGVLAVALSIGLLTGALEGAHLFVRKSITPLSAAVLDQTFTGIWMAPLGEAAFMLGVGLALVVATAAWRKPISIQLVTTLFAALGAYGLLRAARLGLGMWPVRLLALGIGVQAGALVAARSGIFIRRWRSIVAGLMVWAGLAALAMHGGRAVRQWWTLRSLPPAEAGAPNVLLLILDTVREQSLGLYEHERPTTPRLEALAREGLVIDGAVSVTSWTLPAHASMLTGRYPWELSARWTAPLDDRYPTVAEALARRGYATAGFVANYWFAGRGTGIARGFGHFEDEPVSGRMVLQNSWLANRLASGIRSRLGWHVSQAMDAREVADEFLDWSRDQAGRPFFAMLNLLDAHAPYSAPDSVLARFSSGRPRNWLTAGRLYTPAELEELRTSYDAAIAYIDQEIGRIAETLRRRGQLDRTVLIVTSDHGEQLGEREPDLIAHANSLYASSIEVPLLIRYPPAVPAGVRIRRNVTTRRVAATVMDLTGAGGTEEFPGRSLAAEFRPGAPQFDERPAVSFLRPAEATIPSDPVAAGPMASVTWKHWQYIRNGNGREELYDLLRDPWETRDRSRERQTREIGDRLRIMARMLDSIAGPEVGRSMPGAAPATGQRSITPFPGAASRRATAARRAGSA